MQDIHGGLHKCKDLARVVKHAQVVYEASSTIDLEKTLPRREVCDELVQLYVNNFETTSR